MERLAAEVGLTLVEKQDFHSFYNYHIKTREYAQLFQRMKVVTEDQAMSPKEWEAAGRNSINLLILLIMQ